MTYKIAHLADVHIKNLKYHYEYRHVFNQLYAILRKNEVDYIYIGGDIAHTKTQISPEFVQLCSELFTNLAEIAPLYIILGNHDGNLRNKSRQDAITPIVNALDNPNIHLLAAAGETIVTDDLAFNVLSVFDEDNWVKPSSEDRINIAFYHGCVAGVQTDAGWVMEYGDHDVSIFAGHDFAMLGDIHKTNQILDEDGRVRYCGSIVQQNHGETNDKGFLIWEINSKDDFTVTHHKLLNPKPFITIELTPKGRLPKNVQVPDGARLRLVANNSLPADRLRRAIEIVKHRFKPESVSFLNRAAGQRGSVDNLADGLKKENLRDPSVQEKFITEYLKDFEVTEEELDRVFELNRKYSTLAQENEDVSRNVDWKLESIEWDNLFNYGEDNKIDFNKTSGIVGIFGKNYSGKSSTIDGLLYTMFNSTSKNERKNLNIINQNKEGCRGVVKASIGDETYEIHRTSEKYVKRLKGQETTEAKTDVDFFKTNLLGEKEELNGLTRNDTDKKIRKVFGTMEDFLLTSMASQLGSLSFIGEGSTKRKEILAKFLDLEIFEKKFKMAKDDSSSIKGALKLLEGKDFVNLITAASKELRENGEVIDGHKATCEVTREEIRSVQALMQDVESQIASIPTQMIDYDAVQEELGTNELDLYKADEALKNLQQEYHEKEKLLTNIAAFLSDIDIDDIFVKKELLATKQEELSELNNIIKLLDREQANNQKKMKMLETHEYDPDCHYCSENKFVKDAHTAKQKFAENAAKLATLHNESGKIEADISALNEPEIIKKHNQYEQLAKKKSDVERKLTKCELDIERNKSTKLSAEHNIQRLLKEIDTYNENKEAIEKLSELNKQKRNYNKNIFSLNKTLENCDNELKELYVKHGSLEQQVESLRDQKQELEDLRNQYSAYDLYMRCMHSNGIAYDIIKKKLPAINDEIAKVLTNIVNFEVYLESADKRLNIFIKHPRFEPRPLEMGSGAEKTIASMAIRLALLSVSSLPKGDIFILDEPGTALDEENMEGFVRILDLIKAQFKTILLISHLDSLKDCVDSQIVIEKKDGYAFINH